MIPLHSTSLDIYILRLFTLILPLVLACHTISPLLNKWLRSLIIIGLPSDLILEQLSLT